ncbi:hypothetical protein WFK62_04705 [Yersinia enterocolitica]|uniref:hypothetical protein n=1 Tax=Yersinia TaxID=629 RepID=UPI00158345B5|nr:hypothetical protein [Yersinia artesiana]EKN3585012.1 hypothetical protein [Yersinia enterocolitica]EKN6294668.1 hypothetical protein [Yersinia enterocolitica]ELW7389950.1 hypothetical protein [Yersinia enterocolitica]HDZ8858759.1 hypothetical protein [Yersinia enterocolitica]HEA9982779.1 hypothetical protein [Yersinia enterocolitica]
MKVSDASIKILSEIDDYIYNYANVRTNGDIQELLSIWEGMTYSDRISMAHRIDAKDMAEVLISDKGTVGGSMITTVLLLRLLGLNNTAARLEFLTHSALMHAQLSETIEDIKFKGKISKKNSDNASGPKNKNYEQTISILTATWNEYPNTTKNSMIKRVYGYFNGAVSEQSIGRWIKEEGFGPKQKVRPCPPFKLVIPS